MPRGALTPADRAYNMSRTGGSIFDRADRQETIEKERELVDKGKREDIVRKSGKLKSPPGFIERRTSGAVAKKNLEGVKRLFGGGGKAEAKPAPKTLTESVKTDRPSKNVIKRAADDIRGSRYNAQVFRDDAERSRSHKPKNKYILDPGLAPPEPPRPRPRPKKAS